MDGINRESTRDIGKTQPARTGKKGGGWGWHLAMVSLGAVGLAVVGVMGLWLAGGVEGIKTLRKVNTALVQQVTEQKLETPLYQNATVGYQLEYPGTYQIEQKSEIETVVTTGFDKDALAVRILGVGESTVSGEPKFECDEYEIDCSGLIENGQFYQNGKGAEGIESSVQVVTASGAAMLRAYLLDGKAVEFKKILVWPMSEAANDLAKVLADKITIIPSN